MNLINLVPASVREWGVGAMARVLQQTIPTELLGKISGWGEPYQIGSGTSLANIQSYLRVAEQGNTYYLFTLYRDMILNSAHIQTELGKRVMSVIGQTESIQPFDKDNPDDVIAARVISDMINNCDNWLDGCKWLMGGHLWPVAVCEKIFERVSEEDAHKWKYPVQWRLKRLWPVNYALLCYQVPYWNGTGTGSRPYGSDMPPDVATNGARPYGANVESPTLLYNPDEWEPDLRFWSVLPNGQINWDISASYKPDPARHVVHRGNITSGFRDNYGGALRGVLFWWFLASLARDWFSRFMERYGSPFAVAYVNSADKNLVDFVTKAFSSATKTGALIIDSKAKIELEQTMVNGAADGYTKFIGLCEDEITKAMLGQILSTKATGTGMGSGVSDLQGDVKDDWRVYDERVIGDTKSNQIFAQFLKINGYRGRAKSVHGGLSNANRLLLAKTLQTARQGGIRPTVAAMPLISQRMGFEMEMIPEAEVVGGAGGGGDKTSKGGGE